MIIQTKTAIIGFFSVLSLLFALPIILLMVPLVPILLVAPIFVGAIIAPVAYVMKSLGLKRPEALKHLNEYRNNYFLNLDSQLINKADLKGKELYKANLNEARLVDCHGEAADMSAVCAEAITVRQCRFPRLEAFKANFKNALFRRTNLRRANFRKAVLLNSKMHNTDCRHANFEQAELSGAKFEDCRLQKANLDKAKLIRVNFKNSQLQRASIMDARLQNSDLESANLCGANLMGANLCGANLKHAKINEVKWYGAIFDSRTILPFSKKEAIYLGMKEAF